MLPERPGEEVKWLACALALSLCLGSPALAQEALDILASPLLANFQRELGRLTLEYKLPTICQFREMVEAGCLASYGVKRPEM